MDLNNFERYIRLKGDIGTKAVKKDNKIIIVSKVFKGIFVFDCIKKEVKIIKFKKNILGCFFDRESIELYFSDGEYTYNVN